MAAGICSQPARVSDRYGRTLLHAAASSGRKRVVEWLVGVKGAALNPKDAESGNTALHRAIYSGQESTEMCEVALIFLSPIFQMWEKTGPQKCEQSCCRGCLHIGKTKNCSQKCEQVVNDMFKLLFAYV